MLINLPFTISLFLMIQYQNTIKSIFRFWIGSLSIIEIGCFHCDWRLNVPWLSIDNTKVACEKPSVFVFPVCRKLYQRKMGKSLLYV